MNQQEQDRLSGAAGSAGNEADRLARDAKASAQGLAGEAKAAAGDVAAEAREAGRALKDEAAGLAGQVRQGLAAQVEAGKDQVADRLGDVADRVQSSADEMRGRGGGEAWIAELMDRGARELDGFADALKRRDLSSLAGSVEGFARRQPALFLGTTVALGFALARLARAAAAEDEGREAAYGRGTAAFDGGYGSYGGGTDFGTTGNDYSAARSAAVAGYDDPYRAYRSGGDTSTSTDANSYAAGGAAAGTGGGAGGYGLGVGYGAGPAGPLETATTSGGGAGGGTTGGVVSGATTTVTGSGHAPSAQPGATEYERHMAGAAGGGGGGDTDDESKPAEGGSAY